MEILVPALKQFLTSSHPILAPFTLLLYTTIFLIFLFLTLISQEIVYLPSNCFFTINDIELGLSALKTSKSAGPDGLLGTFLYNLRSAPCFFLWLIFRRSLDTGIFPSMFKISSVTPVYKTGDKSYVNNYRPISIQNHIAKLFE